MVVTPNCQWLHPAQPSAAPILYIWKTDHLEATRSSQWCHPLVLPKQEACVCAYMHVCLLRVWVCYGISYGFFLVKEPGKRMHAYMCVQEFRGQGLLGQRRPFHKSHTNTHMQAINQKMHSAAHSRRMYLSWEHLVHTHSQVKAFEKPRVKFQWQEQTKGIPLLALTQTLLPAIITKS